MSLPDLAIVGGDVVTTHVGPATVVVHAGRIERLQAPAQPAPGREDAFEGPATTGLAHVLQVLEMLRDLGLRCVFHAEDESLIDLYTARVLQHDGPDRLRHDASSPPSWGPPPLPASSSWHWRRTAPSTSHTSPPLPPST